MEVPVHHDSSLTFWLFVCLFAPIVFGFLCSIMWAVVALFDTLGIPIMLGVLTSMAKSGTIPRQQRTVAQPKIIYKDRIVYRDKVVYRDRPVKKTKPSPKKQPQTQPQTDPNIVKEVIAGLKSLGFSASDAKKTIADLCSQKVYTNSESLLTDCISHVK